MYEMKMDKLHYFTVRKIILSIIDHFICYVIASHSSNIPCMKLLLDLGADPSIPDNDGELPSSVAQTDEEKAVWAGGR
jgi:hypothetical protein